MRDSFILLPALVLLGACDAAPPPQPTATPQAPVAPVHSPEPPTSGTPITAVGDLIGEYRVAGIDGEPLDEPVGIALSIDGPMMSFGPDCAGFVWAIAFEDGQLRSERQPGPRPEAGSRDSSACRAAILPVHTRLAAALDAVVRAERTPQNGILLSGGEHDVTPFSQ